MDKNTRLSMQEDADRAALVQRVSSLLSKTPPATAIATAARAAAFKDASRRARAAIAKPKASLRVLREYERELVSFIGEAR